MPSENPKNAGPPVVEFALGVQFSNLVGLTGAHVGLFWDELGRMQWNTVAEDEPIPNQFEQFDSPNWKKEDGRVRLQLVGSILSPRIKLNHVSKTKSIQVQTTRLHLNWQKANGIKPDYHELSLEFMQTYSLFSDFVERVGIGPIAPNQWELSYINEFQYGSDWSMLQDWSGIAPGLFGKLFESSRLGLTLDYRRANWSFAIDGNKGRLHIHASPGKWSTKVGDNSLILTTTARGPVDASTPEAVRRGLDLGHEKSLFAFESYIDTSLLNKWKNVQ
jgi:hypothetical protein